MAEPDDRAARDHEALIEMAAREVAKAIWGVVLVFKNEARARGVSGIAKRQELVERIVVLVRLVQGERDTKALRGNFRALWLSRPSMPIRFRWLAAAVLVVAPIARAAEPAAQALIEGTVTDGGKPVADAVVAAIPYGGLGEFAARARTDALGRFRLTGLALRSYGVTATAAGHTAGFTLDVKPQPDRVTRVDVTLGRDGHELRGTVVDASSGQRLAPATIVLARMSNVDGDIFVTDAPAGSFAVRLPPGRYGVLALVQSRPRGETSAMVAAATPPIVVPVERAWPAGPPPIAVLEWIRLHAVALVTVDAEHGFADLAPLGPAIGKARIVGLGEATHGTHEFFALKHRLIEWLITERGFSLVAIEASMPMCEALNQYVLTGKGDPEKLLVALYPLLNTEELLALLRWVRRWNEDPKHTRVQFYGVDMQFMPHAIQTALAYVARVAPQDAERLGARLSLLSNPIDHDDVYTASAQEKGALESAVKALAQRFDSERARWTARTSPAEWIWARQQVRLLEQFMTLIDDPGYKGARDRAMADNVSWILDQHPGAKMVVWAHNSHVQHDDLAEVPPMGEHLRRRFGKQYVNLGFAFDHGGFRAWDFDHDYQTRSFVLPPLPVGSLDHTLSAVGIPHFIVDLRVPKIVPIANWWAAAHAHRDFGANFSTRLADGFAFAFPRHFDLLAFVEATTPSRPLSMYRAPEHFVLPEPKNLDFEEADGQQPRDWTVAPQSAALGWAVEASTDRPFRGARCALVHSLPGEHAGEYYGKISQLVNLAPYRGKHVRLSAAARADVAAGGGARLFIEAEVWSIPPSTPSDRMRDRPITESGWKRYSVEIDVPPWATTLIYGGALWGQGRACFDDFKIEVVSRP